MKDEIQVHFNSDSGELELLCGSEAFGEIRDAVFKSARMSDLEEISPSQEMSISVWTTNRNEFSTPTWSERFGFVTCGLVAFAVIFILAQGILTIAGWFTAAK